MVDRNDQLINRVINGIFDFYEPELDLLLEDVFGLNPPRFEFHHNFEESIQQADIIFIATEMKPKTKPTAKKGEPDWTEWANTWKHLVYNVDDIEDKIIVDITTLPLDFERLLKFAISPIDPLDYQIVLNPSLISEGTAIQDLHLRSNILIASRVLDAGNVIRDLYNHWVPPHRIHNFQRLGSALLAKLGLNFILSSSVVAMNTLNSLATRLPETEISEVSQVITTDFRVEEQYHSYGIGFGGPGLERCLHYLSDAARGEKLIDESVLFKQLIKVNESTKRDFVKKMKLHMAGTTNKIIAILGFTYKKWTESFVNSPAIQICLELVKEEGATIRIFDPILSPADMARITDFDNYQTKIQILENVYEACHGTDAICILTDWVQFLNLNYAHIFNNMRQQQHVPTNVPTIFLAAHLNFNPHNQIPHPLEQLGFRVVAYL